MFRSDSQAFLALPSEDPELRAAINDTLAKYEVRGISSHESTKAQTSADSTQERIRKADFVIADISGFKPNVLFELGMAIGMGKRLLLLSKERSTDCTIDLAAQQVA